MKTTLRQIDKALEEIARAHVQVADYFWGDWSDSFEGREQKYPAIVCNVETPVDFTRVSLLTIHVICVDQVATDQSNLKDVESDTLQIVHDFCKVMKYSESWKGICAVQSATADLKFKDKSPDEVAGWQGTIKIKLIEELGMCDLPLEGYDETKKINC